MTLLDQYAQQFPEDRDRLYRAWRVCYAFDRFDLFDAIVNHALAEGDPGAQAIAALMREVDERPV